MCESTPRVCGFGKSSASYDLRISHYQTQVTKNATKCHFILWPIQISGSVKLHRWLVRYTENFGSVSIFKSKQSFCTLHIPDSASAFKSGELSALRHSRVGPPSTSWAHFQHPRAVTFLHLDIHEWPPPHSGLSFNIQVWRPFCT